MKRIFGLLSAIIMILTMASCAKTEATDNSVVETPSEIVSSEPEKEPLPISAFTGLEIEKDRTQRSVCVMINNIKVAMPQAGIGDADIIFENETEGGITRLLACFYDIEQLSGRLGPVRSARHPFINYAKGLGANFVHFGKSALALELIKSEGLKTLDGTVRSNFFVTDQERKKKRGVEHAHYATLEGLKEGLAAAGADMTPGDPVKAFNFKGLEDDKSIGGTPVTNITVNHSWGYVSKYTYDAASKLYLKSQFDAPHIDENSGKQLAVTNVFVLFAPIFPSASVPGLMDIDLTGGNGYYFSNGEKIDIAWTKGDIDNNFTFKKLDGTELKVNVGKTWVHIVNTGIMSKTTFE